MDWFFGCKLHLIMSQSGKIVSTALSNEHTADIKMIEHLVEGLKTKLYAVRGYISQELKIKFEESRHLVQLHIIVKI